MEPQKYYINDPESGSPQEVSKAEYDRYVRLSAAFKPVLSTQDTAGLVSIFGTGADLDAGFSNIWEIPGNFNLLT